MAIRPEFRPFYGPEWRKYRAALIEKHGAVCTVCGVRVARGINLAHLVHDPRSPLVALMCAADHNRHDAAHRYAIWRRNRARESGQAWLLPEIEHAPYAGWMIPQGALASAQERLFA
jgi:hypothetical protein